MCARRALWTSLPRRLHASQGPGELSTEVRVRSARGGRGVQPGGVALPLMNDLRRSYRSILLRNGGNVPPLKTVGAHGRVAGAPS